MPGKILSSEKVGASDSESESSGSDGESSKSAEAPLSQKRRKQSSTPLAPQSTAKRAKIAEAPQTTPPSSDESSSEDDDDQETEDTTTTASNGLISSRTIPKDYTPPDGFTAVRGSNSSTSSELDRLFSSSNLAGKQIWHITLASGIPITSIKEVDLEQAHSGTTIIEHNGVEFGLRVESSEGTGKDGLGLLVPADGGTSYNSAPLTFDTTLHVQQSVHPATSYAIPKALSLIHI